MRSNGAIYLNIKDKLHISSISAKWNDGGKSISGGNQCQGLFVVDYASIYCSVKDGHQVKKSFLEKKQVNEGKGKQNEKRTWVVAAGKELSGATSDKLDRPQGIYVDHDNLDLYVADSGNNRIQLFRNGSYSGTTIVNASIKIDNKGLNKPTNIILDANRSLYIADSGNHRIILFEMKSQRARCLVGCSTPSVLNSPTSISFDGLENMFVTDSDQARIQQFTLANDDCGE